MTATLTRDYEVWEVASAVVIAAAIQLGAGVVLWLQKDTIASVPEVDKASFVPVKVTPVVDLDMLPPKLGGGKRAVLPDMWQRATPSVKKAVQEKPPEDVVAPSTKASEKPEDIPDKDKPVTSVDAGPDASTEGADAGQVEGTEDAGVATLDTDGGTSSAPGPGCSGPECKAEGSLDDFQRRQYAARLVAHVKRGGFVVSGSPLPEDELKKLRVSAVIQLDGQTITGYSMGSSGDAACDAAARAKLDAAKGSQVPPPPEDHPEFLQPSYSVTFACAN